jgi:hypothetical protein
VDRTLNEQALERWADHHRIPVGMARALIEGMTPADAEQSLRTFLEAPRFVVTASAFENYARRHNLTIQEAVADLQARWERAQEEAFRDPETRFLVHPDPNPQPLALEEAPMQLTPFLQRLQRALGSDWTWTPDVVCHLWRVEHGRGLRFEVTADLGVFSSEPLEEAPKMAAVLLDAVEDGQKGLVTVLQRRISTYTYEVQPVPERS